MSDASYQSPERPLTFIALHEEDDAKAIATARSLLDRNERVVFDCDWSGVDGIALLGLKSRTNAGGS